MGEKQSENKKERKKGREGVGGKGRDEEVGRGWEEEQGRIKNVLSSTFLA